MSRDLEIWSVRPIDLRTALTDGDAWERTGGVWVASRGVWQITAGPSDRVWPEDIPDDILPLLPGIEYLTHLHLEPASAPPSAHQLLERTARSLAKHAWGVIRDPQDDGVLTPSGVKRYRPTRRDERFAVVELTWWFLNGPVLANGGVSKLVDALATYLPEALPVRYGLFEPPQHRYEGDGRHFKAFLEAHLDDLMVWYPRRPVVGAWIDADRGSMADRRGFRAGVLSLTVESAALELPGWEAGLRRAWRRLSSLIEPFYGDVRMLDGYMPSGATYAVDARTEEHPAAGPDWRGIPDTLGQAVVLGAPYQDVWPAFRDTASVEDGLWFCATPTWRERADVSAICGPPPAGLTRPAFAPGAPEYPPTWPFSEL